jgi:hypothetical protein
MNKKVAEDLAKVRRFVVVAAVVVYRAYAEWKVVVSFSLLILVSFGIIFSSSSSSSCT